MEDMDGRVDIPQPPEPSSSYADANDSLLDSDEEYQKAIKGALVADATAPGEPPKPEGLSAWGYVKSLLNRPVLQNAVALGQTVRNHTPGLEVARLALDGTDLGKAVDYGAASAFQEASQLATTVGATVTKNTWSHLLSKENRDAYLKWYSKNSNEWDLTIPGTEVSILASQKKFDDWAGPNPEGVYGFVAGATQFATGMIMSGAALKGVSVVPGIGKAAAAIDKTRFLKGGLKGVITDFSFFDPYQERLSNMLADGPEWFSVPLKEYIFRPALDPIKAKKEDSELLARIKNAAEGYLTGQAVEGILLVAKYTRMKFLAGGVAKNIPKEELEALNKEFGTMVDEAQGGAAPKPGEPAVVVPQENGKAAVVVPEAKATIADLTETVNHEPAKLDYEHTPVKSVDEIKPDALTVGVKDGADGEPQYVVRAVQMVEGGKPKVLEVPLSDIETIKKLNAINPKAIKQVPLVGNKMSKAEWAAWEEGTKRPPQKDIPTNVGSPTNQQVNPANVVAEHANHGAAVMDAAAFNMAAKNIQKAGEPLSEEAKKAFAVALKEYGDRGDPRGVAEILSKYGWNPGYVQQPDDVVNIVKALVDAAPKASQEARNIPRSMAEVKAAAEKLFPEMSDDVVRARAAEMFGGLEALPEKLLAMRAWMWHQAGQIKKLTILANSDPGNARIADMQMAALNTLFEVHAMVTGSSTKVAQTLQIHQQPLGELAEAMTKERQLAQDVAGAIPGKDAPLPPAPQPSKELASIQSKLKAAVDAGKLTHRAPDTYDLAKGLSRQEVQALSRLVLMADGDLEGMLKLITGPKQADLAAAGKKVPEEVKKSWFKYVNRYRVEALLSAFSTQLGNVISNAGVAVKRPFQLFIEGVQSGDRELMNEGSDLFAGLFLHMAESAKLSARAFKMGQGLFEGGAAKSSEVAADLIALEASALKNGNLPGNLAMALFKMPSRMLLGADEFFRQVNGRAYTRAQILKQARADGIVDPQVLAQRVEDGMKLAFDPTGATNYPQASKYSKEMTFTEDLGPVAQKWMNAIQSTELGKFVVPFFKTPANIFIHAWEEAPILNMLNKKMVEDIAAGGHRGAVARAKADFGSVMYGIAAYMALAGNVTGNGPTDPALRKQWIQAGNQPYSFKVGGTWVSYRRGDPFATGFGLVADLVSMAGEMSASSKASLDAAVIAALANNVTSKTFMQGASEFLDAVASGDVKDVQTFLKSSAGSFVPNVLVRSNPDDVLREARTILDGVQSRIPGFSTTLEPRRNIFGEKVMKAPGLANRAFNPFTMSDVPKDGDVANELVKLGKAIPMPSESMRDIDLTDRELFGPDRNGQSPYDRMMELMGDPPGGLPPLRKALEDLIKSDAYKKLPASSAREPGGLRHTLVSELVQAYQKAAQSQLLIEYPSLKEALKQSYTLEAKGNIGGRPEAQKYLKEQERLFIKP